MEERSESSRLYQNICQVCCLERLEGFRCQNILIHAGCGRLQLAEEESEDRPTNWTQVDTIPQLAQKMSSQQGLEARIEGFLEKNMKNPCIEDFVQATIKGRSHLGNRSNFSCSFEALDDFSVPGNSFEQINFDQTNGGEEG